LENESLKDVAKDMGAELVIGEWPAEILQRQASLQYLSEKGFSHAVMPESDEIIDPASSSTLINAARVRLAHRVYVDLMTTTALPKEGPAGGNRSMQLLMVEDCRVWPHDMSPTTTRLTAGGTKCIFRQTTVSWMFRDETGQHFG